jgi:hypothetical protein
MWVKFLKSVTLSVTTDETDVTVYEILFTCKWRTIQTSWRLRHLQFLQTTIEFMWHGPVGDVWLMTVRSKCKYHMRSDMLMIKRKWYLGTQTVYMFFCNDMKTAAFCSFEVFASLHTSETVDLLIPQALVLFKSWMGNKWMCVHVRLLAVTCHWFSLNAMGFESCFNSISSMWKWMYKAVIGYIAYL